MKKYFVFIFIAFFGCKTTLPIKTKINNEVENTECVLTFLSKTQNYKDQIEKYRSIYRDTAIQIESKDLMTTHYKTILNLKTEEYYLWLLKVVDTNVDSILIHCIAQSKSVDAEFDSENCRIQIETNHYDEIGNPLLGTTEFIGM